jgi:hypothetical protein
VGERSVPKTNEPVEKVVVGPTGGPEPDLKHPKTGLSASEQGSENGVKQFFNRLAISRKLTALRRYKRFGPEQFAYQFLKAFLPPGAFLLPALLAIVPVGLEHPASLLV